MRAEEGRADRHVALFAKTASRFQGLDLAVAVETVTGFDFDGGDAFGNQRIEAGQGFAHQVVFAGGTQVLDRGNNAAASARDFLIGCTVETQFELVRAIACMDKMRVAVDQSRRDEPVATIYPVEGIIFTRQRAFGADIDDPAIPDGNRRPFDQTEICGIFRQRRNASVGENGA